MMKFIKRCIVTGFIAAALTVPVLGFLSSAPAEDATTPVLIAQAPPKTDQEDQTEPEPIQPVPGRGGGAQTLGYTWGG